MTYVDQHRLQSAFVANALERLADLIVGQGEALLRDAGVDFPSRAASTVLMLGERGGMSAADIAAALTQPHQLVTQRIEHLIGLGVVRRVADPGDGRRKVLELTPKGRRQFQAFSQRLSEAAAAFDDLFIEIGCDLPDIVQRAAAALRETTLLDRVRRRSSRKVKK